MIAEHTDQIARQLESDSAHWLRRAAGIVRDLKRQGSFKWRRVTNTENEYASPWQYAQDRDSAVTLLASEMFRRCNEQLGDEFTAALEDFDFDPRAREFIEELV